MNARALLAACAVASTPGCGGGADEPSVTVVYHLELFDETRAFGALLQEVERRGVTAQRIECGILLNWKALPSDTLIWFSSTPRLAYMTFSAGDFEAVKDIGWLARVDERWLATFDAPFDCTTGRIRIWPGPG